LKELTMLSEAHPKEATVRDRLAVALLNAHAEAIREHNSESADHLLKELRKLSETHPGDDVIRSIMAKASGKDLQS
jgi:hypothetical protein